MNHPTRNTMIRNPTFTLTDPHEVFARFPGCHYHSHNPQLPYNRFELEMLRHGSIMNSIVLSYFLPGPFSSSNQTIPPLTPTQVTPLALLSSSNRMLSEFRIVCWVRYNFPVFNSDLEWRRTFLRTLVFTIYPGPMAWGQNDIVYFGQAETIEESITSQTERHGLYLVSGAEDRIFVSLFTASHS